MDTSLDEELRISVVIPAFNALPYLKETIASLEAQQGGVRFFEVIVVDDGSSDGTDDYLRAYQGPLRLISVILSSNRGRSAARNAGIAKASAKLLLLMDADMRVAPDFVAGHLSAHTDSNVVVVGQVRFDHSSRIGGYSKYWERRGAQRNSRLGTINPRYFLSGASSLPTDLARKIGGFDEIINYGEDIDFGLRLAQAAAKMVYNPNLTSIHLHQRELSDVLGVLYNFGVDTLPILIKKHPRLRDELRVSLSERTGIAGMVIRAAMSNIIHHPMLILGKWLDHWGIASPIFTYLIFRAYISGWRRSV